MTPVPVTVWRVALDQPTDVVVALAATLDDTEVAVARRRLDETSRARYVVAHGAFRAIVADELGITPAAVAVSRRCRWCGDAVHGKPTIPSHPGLDVSLSHAASVALVAAARDGTCVGVDVEVVRPRARLDRLAARVLAAPEHAAWAAAAPAEQLERFLQAWTAKEAYLKAIGRGATVALRDVPLQRDGWTITSVASPPGTVASVAVDRAADVRVATWTPRLAGARLSASGGTGC